MKKKPIKKSTIILRVLAVLMAALLIYAVSKLDFAETWRQVQKLPLSLFVGLLLMQIVTQLLLNMQWYRLCSVLKIPGKFSSLLVVNALGTLTDAANPGEKVGGEVARVVSLNRLLGLETKQSTSLVAIQKILSISALFMLTLLAVLIFGGQLSFLPTVWSRLILTLILGLALFGLQYLLFKTTKVNKRVQSWKSEGKVAMGLKRWMERFAADTQAINTKPREWVLQLALSFFVWSLFPLKLYLIVSQFTEVSFLPLYAITFISYFAAMIPLLPGGIGTFEATMTGMLLTFSLTPETAFSISLIFRFVTFWFVILLSALVILVWKLAGLAKKRTVKAGDGRA